MNEAIWMRDERTWGTLLSLGASMSLVRYTWKGTRFEEWVENDDFMIVEED